MRSLPLWMRGRLLAKEAEQGRDGLDLIQRNIVGNVLPLAFVNLAHDDLSDLAADESFLS